MINTLLEKINDPISIAIILILYFFWLLLSKSEDVAAWKRLFSKDRSEELKKAREEVQDLPEEAAFYDEALRQERFYTATGIRCSKKDRRIYQKLVIEGTASVEGIRRSYIHIFENNGRVEVNFSCIEKIIAVIFTVAGLFGILTIYLSLVNIGSLFDLSKDPNTLFLLSGGVLFVFLSLDVLLPMVIARNIRKGLKEQEQKEARSSAASPEESSSPVQET